MVSEIGGSTKLEKRPDCAMDDFELALLPILPIESRGPRVPSCSIGTTPTEPAA